MDFTMQKSFTMQKCSVFFLLDDMNREEIERWKERIGGQ